MNLPFNEGLVSSKTDPLFHPAADFDFEQVERDLGEVEEKEPDPLAEFVRKMFLFCTDVDLSRPDAQEEVARRLFAVAQRVSPSLIDSLPPALAYEILRRKYES
jgi:hypothetical protein